MAKNNSIGRLRSNLLLLAIRILSKGVDAGIVSPYYRAMTVSTSPTRTLPPSITLESVQKLWANLVAREQFLRQLINGFEHKYQCALDELNRRLEARQIAEPPTWEDSIEWGNAIDQLAQVQLMQSIVSWLINLLKPSTSS